MIEYQINEHRDNRRVCYGSATPTDRGRTRPFSNGDAASYDERASTRSNTATRRLAPRRRAHQLSFPTPTNLPSLRFSCAFCLTTVVSSFLLAIICHLFLLYRLVASSSPSFFFTVLFFFFQDSIFQIFYIFIIISH